MKLLAKDCGFPADIVDEMIRDRLVYGTNSLKVQERFINRGTDLDLPTALNIACAYESAQSQLKKMTGEAAQVQVIKSDRRYTRKGPASGKKGGTNGATSANKTDGKATKLGNTGQQCGNCGYAPHTSTDQCPACGKRCGKCGKKNHFAALCRQKTVHTVEDANIDSDDGEDFYIECAHSTTHKDQGFVELTCNGTKMPFKIDTGAQANVLPKSDFDKLSIHQPRTQSTVTLRGYGGRELDTLGMCDLNCMYKDVDRNLQFHVVNEDAPAVLGLKSCVDMNLVKLILSVDTPIQTGMTTDTELNKLITEYQDIFHGFGKFPGEHSFTLRPDAEPVVHPPRRVPVALRNKVKQELDRMVSNDIITKVTEPTDWVNSMVVVQKSNGDLRVCLDPRDLNKAIKRPYYPVPTLNDVTSELAGAKHFSVLDARSGYWQIKLSDTSSRLTTCNTPFRRFRYLRMPFGVNSAQDVFQRRVDETYENLPGVTGSAITSW